MEKLNRSYKSPIKSPDLRDVYSNDFIERPYLPDCWTDDKRMDVLFNPFRIRDTNPEGWDLKMNFWINLINKWCLHERKSVFTIDELRRNFIRDERLPHLDCMKLVVSHMKRQNRLLFKEELNSSKKNSTISFSTWNFLVKPFTYGWSMISKDDHSIEDKIIPISQDYPLINKETLEILTESVESYIKTMETTCLSYTKFLNILNKNVFIEKNSDEASLEVVLNFLESKDKIKIYEESSFKIVKFGNDNQIKESDITLVKLEMTKEVLEKEANQLEEKIYDLNKDARTAIQNGSKDKALFLLKRKKRLENRLKEKDQQIDNIDIICGQLLETGSQQLMLKAFQMANEMLKKNSTKIDDVENIMLQIDETLNDVSILSSELNKPIGENSIMELEAEKELEEMLEEISKHDESINKQNENDLIEKLDELSIQDDSLTKNKNEKKSEQEIMINDDNNKKKTAALLASE